MKEKPIVEMDERELIYALLAEKVGSVDPNDVFYAKPIESGQNAGKYTALLGGKKLNANQLQQLQQEAVLLEQMFIWKVMTATLPHEAELRMFKLAKTERDMDWGKAILHSVGVMETIVKAIKNTLPEDTKV